MKKNIFMRLACVVLVLTLLSTCVISGTFAKYVTTNGAADNARVAKFGVVIQADGALFNESYLKATNTPADTGTLSVISNSSDDVVAPGTKNDDGLNFSINGQPEVSTRLDVTIESKNIYLKAGTYAVMVAAPEVSATSWEADKYYTEAAGVYTLSNAYAEDTDYFTMENKVVVADDYYPVVYKADLTTGTVEADSLAAIAADYAKKLNNNVAVAASDSSAISDTYTFTKEYDPNFNYASLNVAGDTLTWEWDFDAAGAGTYDGADTILGDLMAGTLTNAEVVKVDGTIEAPVAGTDSDANDYCLETSFSVNISVTQVD